MLGLSLRAGEDASVPPNSVLRDCGKEAVTKPGPRPVPGVQVEKAERRRKPSAFRRGRRRSLRRRGLTRHRPPALAARACPSLLRRARWGVESRLGAANLSPAVLSALPGVPASGLGIRSLGAYGSAGVGVQASGSRPGCVCARVRGAESQGLLRAWLCLGAAGGVSAGASGRTAQAARSLGYLSRSVLGGCAQISGRRRRHRRVARCRAAAEPRSDTRARTAAAGRRAWNSARAGQDRSRMEAPPLALPNQPRILPSLFVEG
ncbi:uncharacterized protein LOC125753955 [Canis lupus dingo]|uniref:uncharacterized protein LOC125753955 n=1 Tax=Canis lupus dingo TaxID=286419 RepID=UPI0020C4DF72|nr:uncharacterized protein LOC125753955 [Canis lupus dingo]